MDQHPTALQSLGLHVDGHYLNAARVFFATSTTATIIDQHDFNGDILTLIEEAENTFSRTSGSA